MSYMSFRKKIYNLLFPIINREVAKKSKLSYQFRNIFGYIFIPKISSVQGYKMNIYKKGHSFELAFDDIYEKYETNFLKSRNLCGKICVDIGACIGYYTLLFAGAVGKEGKVISFEPDINNYHLLEKNVSINNFENVDLCQSAVGNTTGNAYLAVHKSPGQHALNCDAFKNKRPLKKINIVKLDDYIVKKNIKPEMIGYVKIDAEGYEFEVLKGMHDIMSCSKSLIVQFEFAPQHLREQKCDILGLINYIRTSKYNVYFWDFKRKSMIQIIDIDWLIRCDILKEFESGANLSRNIILSKKMIDDVNLSI